MPNAPATEKFSYWINVFYILSLVLWSISMLFYGGVGILLLVSIALGGGDAGNQLFTNNFSIWSVVLIFAIAYYTFPFVYYFANKQYKKTQRIPSLLWPLWNFAVMVSILLLSYVANTFFQ